jgi:predicted nicotinamide N-methyase
MGALERYALREYELEVGGLALRVIGVRSPDELLDDPELERRFAEDEYLPYWATPWPTSYLLAAYAVERGSPAHGAVLELGCGLGIASLALAQRGFDVTASDYEPEALRFVERSAALNGVALKTRLVDWRRTIDERYARIVAADVLYEPHTAPSLAAFLSRSLARGGTAWIADPGRASFQRFVEAARAAGLACERDPIDLSRARVPVALGKPPASACVFVVRRAE